MRHLNRLFNISTAVGGALIGGAIGFQYGKAKTKEKITTPEFHKACMNYQALKQDCQSLEKKVAQCSDDLQHLERRRQIVAGDYDPGLPIAVECLVNEAAEEYGQALAERDRCVSRLKHFYFF